MDLPHGRHEEAGDEESDGDEHGGPVCLAGCFAGEGEFHCLDKYY